MEGKESLPTLVGNKQNKNLNPQSNNKDTNLIETFTSTKKPQSVVGGLFKKIHFLEFSQKDQTNSVEYYLNNYLKNNKNIANSFVNNGSPTGKRNSIEIEEMPYNISEHLMPMLDEENIMKILKNNDFFQEQANDIYNLVLNEIIYISVFKGMKIYDIDDTSNYFFIINKGNVELSQKDNNNGVPHKNNEEQQQNNANIKKLFGPWEFFGEISFYNGKQRHEIMIAQENCELYAIDSESFRELIKRNNEIILKEKYNFLNNISIFESLDKISKYNVAQKLKKKEFPANTKIIKKGEVGDTLYIIQEGIVTCRIGDK